MWIPQLVCPGCRGPIGRDPAGWTCASCRQRFTQAGGVFHFLTAPRCLSAQPFLQQYRLVRDREGYRSQDPEYYRRLPHVPRDDRHFAEWRVRRSSYLHLLKQITPKQGGRVLDLGAGNGWLSHRLALRGYAVAAVDWLSDEADGLGACRHYPMRFPAVEADFDALPFEPGQFEVVVLNGALHYSPDPGATLDESRRMLAPGGQIVVMDSPMFERDADGRAMVADQMRQLQTEYDLGEVVRPGVGYLTYAGLQRSAARLGMTGRFLRSHAPLWWRARRQLGRVRLGRAPASFGVWVAR